MKNVLLLIFGAFGLFLAIYYYLQFDSAQQQLQLANQRVLDRDTEIYKLQKQLGIFRHFEGSVKSKAAAKPVVVASPSTQGQLSASEINQLKKRGLENPESALRADLLANQQKMLTTPGSLGGTMAIRDVRILNARHAMAYFEDGHQGGHMMLRYEVKPGGIISWTVLDNYVM